jgi:hypothetical protein
MPRKKKKKFCEMFPNLCVPNSGGPTTVGPTPPIMPSPDALRDEVISALRALNDALEADADHVPFDVALSGIEALQLAGLHELALVHSRQLTNSITASDISPNVDTLDWISQVMELQGESLEAVGQASDAQEVLALSNHLRSFVQQTQGS